MVRIMLSIIIPVYNSEKYLADCLKSVINQQNEEWEIILVNDGSTDNSENICRGYSEKDNRIKLYSKNNEGVSKTRNFGISKANGDYIIFLDSDDILVSGALTIIESKIKTYNADVICYGTYLSYSNLEIKKKYTNIESYSERCIRTEEDFKTYIYKELVEGKNLGIIGNYAVRRTLIEELKFNPNFIMCEDLLFNMTMFRKAKTVVFIPEFLYIYRENDDSCTRTYSYKKILDKKNIVKEKLTYARLCEIKCNKLIVYNWFCSDLIYDYWGIIGDKKTEEVFLTRILNDEEIMNMFKDISDAEDFNCIHPDFRFITGNKFERYILKQKHLFKQTLKRLFRYYTEKRV